MFEIMKVEHLRHASFMIATETETEIITGSHETTKYLNCGGIKKSADIVTVSHEHSTHSNASVR